MIFFKSEETKKKVNNIINQLAYEYKFVFVLAPTVRGFFPIVEQLLVNGSTDIVVSKESIVYLIIATLAQVLDKPVSEIKGLLKEIKERNLDPYLSKIKKVIIAFKQTVNFFLKKTGMITKNYLELFSYTALFVPFALTFSQIIASSGISLDEFISAFTKDFGGKVISTSFGIGAFTLKHFLKDIFNSLSKVKDKSKEIKNIVKSKFIKESLMNESSVLSWDEYSLLT